MVYLHSLHSFLPHNQHDPRGDMKELSVVGLSTVTLIYPAVFPPSAIICLTFLEGRHRGTDINLIYLFALINRGQLINGVNVGRG